MKKNYWHIGDQVIDEDGCVGVVVIYYRDGDICWIENDAAHPNPRKVQTHENNLDSMDD